MVQYGAICTYVWPQHFILRIVMTLAEDEHGLILLYALLPVFGHAVPLRADPARVHLVEAQHAVCNLAREAGWILSVKEVRLTITFSARSKRRPLQEGPFPWACVLCGGAWQDVRGRKRHLAVVWRLRCLAGWHGRCALAVTDVDPAVRTTQRNVLCVGNQVPEKGGKGWNGGANACCLARRQNYGDHTNH